jgi:hypothetical protein
VAKYGRAALMATKLLRTREALSPRAAWLKSVRRIFPDSPSSQEKGCPRGAYLGLCEEGLVRGVPPGRYTGSRLNKLYAVRAAKVLRGRPSLADNEDALWRVATRGDWKTPNNQMEVVIALWKQRFIRP